MLEVRRGRKSQADYKALVGKALSLLDNPFALDEFPVLSRLPTIERWTEAHPYVLLPRSKALRGLLRQAVAEVIQQIGEDDREEPNRLAQYLRLRYQQGLLVKEIAENWSLSVEQVWRSAGRYAIDLVTDQFLQIAQKGDLKGVSEKGNS